MPMQSATLVSILAWTYRDQKADMVSGDDFDQPPDVPAPSDFPAELLLSGRGLTWGRVAEQAASGHVARATDSHQRPALHPDAETVHTAVLALRLADWQAAALVARCARQGVRPDWAATPTCWEPADGWDVNGKAPTTYEESVQVRDRKGRLVTQTVRFTPVRPYPGPEWVEMCRAIYGAWYRGLVLIGAHLHGVPLVRWKVEGIGARAEPWAVG